MLLTIELSGAPSHQTPRLGICCSLASIGQLPYHSLMYQAFIERLRKNAIFYLHLFNNMTFNVMDW
jgi:hypothetical protein